MEAGREQQIEHEEQISDDSFDEIVNLAARLRESTGEDLDDSAVLAVAEATGAPVAYVRLALRSLPVEENATPLERVKSSFLAFDQATRRYIASSVLATALGLLLTLSNAVGDASGLSGTLAILTIIGMAWNCAVARDAKTATLAGGLGAGVAFVMTTLFTFLVGLVPGISNNGPAPGFILLFIPMGAAAGFLSSLIGGPIRRMLGLRDPANERQELLNQLLEIQDRLKSDEKFVTFLSLDVVGSTKMKTENDALSVEYTFNEYHKYVATIAAKHRGRVHSTAGDGVTVAFESPADAYASGRAMMAGLFEFNAFRNKLTKPIELRGGIHTGSVLAPGKDVKSVNFAHVIDIAAHLQKASPVGCLAVSDQTAAYLPGGKEGVGGEQVTAQDVTGVVWRPRSRVVASALAEPQQ
ncbi:MAG TPA: adenylate/guanylate cyclase domain-containing protein [Fimbriimonadaceae bacterium]|nr:adenylate/guanylate cyclase domain-containing protein [Fimbriimonadaceae bacterium]